MRKLIMCFIFVNSLICSIAFAAYPVKGKGISSVFYGGGKAETSKCNDEVVYVVDLEQKKVTRTAIVNADIKEEPFSGLQTDNTEYQIVYVDNTLITRDEDKGNLQHIIKAIGQTGSGDGIETIVIGEDFIMTSNSKFDYFVLYYYKRVQ